MLRVYLTALLLAAALGPARGQSAVPTPASLGYRHLRVPFGRDTAEVLVLAKKGEEQRRKPLLLFVQGSLPQPLIKYDPAKGTAYPVFPFRASLATDAYHLVIIGKPGVPVAASVRDLQPNFRYFDPRTQAPPAAYCQRNHLDYYAARGRAVLRYLRRQPWVDARRVVAAGHSEGSTVVARLAATRGSGLSHAVYLSGNPAGRISSTITQQRRADPDADLGELFAEWGRIVARPEEVTCTPGDAPQTTYSFSRPPQEQLRRARVPVLVLYGARDAAAPFNDAFRLEMMRTRHPRLAFKDYPGLEHNFFGFKDGRIDYDQYYWDEVAQDLLRWVAEGAVPATVVGRPAPPAR